MTDIGDYYEGKREEAERLRKQIKRFEWGLVANPTHSALYRRIISDLKKKLELALYVGD